MKLDIISHCTIDTIEINDSKFVVPGGPGCYCSLTARSLKFDVKLHTKFGSDFPLVNHLVEQKIAFEDALSTKPTTQFILNLANSERTLFLQNKCEPINNITLDSDSAIISPLFDEISIELFEEIKKKTQDLVQSSMKLGEAVYKSQQNAKPDAAAKENDKKDKGKKDDNVVDADFEEVKEDKTKYKDKEKSA